MTGKNITRRDFVKSLGLASITLPAVSVVGRLGADELIRSEDYGGFLIRRHGKGNPPYDVDENMYQRMDQKNVVFSRVDWDPIIQEAEAPFKSVPMDRMEAGLPGYSRLDYAFYRAAWTVHRALGTTTGNGEGGGGLYSWQTLGGVKPYDELPAWEFDDWSPQEVSEIVKKAARFYGASLSGIAGVNEKWIYRTAFNRYTEPKGIERPIEFDDVPEPVHAEDRLIIPTSMKYVISLAFEMDYDGMMTYFGGPGSAATGNGYSRMAFTSACMAEFIRALGYKALPSGNCTGLSIPIAIDAGLGQVGRQGLLITPKYGPRVRLAKIFTDMPLVADSPISFGVTEFCEICGKCADNCPSGAIPTGRNARSYEGRNISSNPGVYKWYVDCEKCHLTWAQEGMDCSKCIQTCPFNKPQSWLHDATRALITVGNGAVDQAILALDDASRYGEQADPRDYWKKENFIHIKNA